MSNYIRRVRVTGLFDQDNSLVVDFDRDLNCIYGFNGTGKTVLIDLIVNVLQGNVAKLSSTPFYSITLLTSSKKQPEKFLTVYNEIDDVYFEFHSEQSWSVELNSSFRNITRKFEVKEDVRYRLAGSISESTKRTDRGARSPNSIAHYIYRSVIERHLSITYVPLRVVNRTEIVHSKAMLSGAERSSDKFIETIQEEFSKQYASAQSTIARKLEELSSTILEKLLFSSEERDAMHFNKKVDDLLAAGKPDESSVRMSKLVNQIKELNLNIPTERISEHYDSWTKIQERLLKANINFKKATEEEREDSFTEYTRAYFDFVQKVGLYDKLQQAITEIEKVYLEKSIHLKKFEQFRDAINDFLSDSKTFYYDDDGTFRFENNGRLVNLQHLSSGEKHLIAILGHLCTSTSDSSVFIADEPELSLHLEWQRKILPTIKKLSPNVQVIVATHSPAIISKEAKRIDIVRCYQND
ncbi:AAA family ATPase [Vibrio tubiashii]|uniref:AAA family ATPase n=1 Tax=Vibrio tubiashii TaxID=29498 RepID=UPI00349EBC84